MRSKSVVTPFIISLFVLPPVFFIVLGAGGPDGAGTLIKVLFTLTLAAEVFVLSQVILARKVFSRSDPMHLTWTLILVFLVVRIIAQSRLATLTFGFVPRYTEGGPDRLFFYVVVLRYLYTLSDVTFVVALFSTVRTYKSTGLSFKLWRRDYLYILVLWAIPALTYVFRSNLELGGVFTSDRYVVNYRLTAVFVGALIASICVILRRYAFQMGGGRVARIWNTIVVAGIARALSFLVLALMLKSWKVGAQFLEQYLLWIFAGCWLLASLYQRELLPRTSESTPASAPASQLAS